MVTKNAVVFPGQGSQRSGMGSDFYSESELFRDIFKRASEAISLDLQEICFTENEKINETEFTQPAILTLEFGIYELLKEKGFSADFFAGHSLGEYSALACADVFDLEDAVWLVRKRGELMQKATPLGVGAMAAVILEQIENSGASEIIREFGAEIANKNSKDQWVISGYSEKIKKTCEELERQIENVRVVPLTVSAPFHSSLMKTIEREFFEILQNIEMRRENCSSVLSNFTGNFHHPETLIENLTKQISGTVRWVENMSRLMETKSIITEVGPNKPLGSFFLTLGAEVSSVINLRSFGKFFKKDGVVIVA